MADAVSSTRNRLLAAARELFTTTGYRATITPMLAARAGVAEGTIYRHFPSKAALLNAVYQGAQRDGLAAVQAAAEGPGKSLGERLGMLGRRWVVLAETDPAQLRLLLVWRDQADLDDLSRQTAAEWHEALARLVALGKQAGSVRPGAAELWVSVWLALVSFAAEKVASGEWAPGHAHVQATLDAAWEAIASRPVRPAGP
ncbi:MAG TPA: TetR/AcrR family transcriptional regulator [Gemmatimonadales bacterium]|jgi:AcrR family transcriptional regulator|nr:TetR/AcrR family transcriptional regulator [Gemmatimonadales bacterium]